MSSINGIKISDLTPAGTLIGTEDFVFVQSGSTVIADLNTIGTFISSILPALTDGTIWIGDGTNTAVANTLSGDIIMTNTGVVTISNDAVTLAKMAGGTIGALISYDALGDPVEVAPGTSGQILTSNGATLPPTFQTIVDLQGITSINADTTAAQVIAGTASRISLVDAGATHTFDIDAVYVGQASITTLGTIITGVWTGTAITGANINAASTDLTDSSVIVRTDQINTYGDFIQTFTDNAITIQSPNTLTPTTLVNAQQTLARNLTIPILTSDRSIVVTGEASQITIGTEVTGASTALTDTAAIARSSNNLSFFASTTSAQLAGIISDETGTGLLVFGTSPTIVTPTIASFTNATHNHQDTAGGGTLLSTSALSDTANIAYLNTTNAYTAGQRQDFLGLLAGTAGLNVGGIAGNPTTQANGDLWYNSTSNILFARINGANVDLAAAGAGDMVLADVQTVTGAKTFGTIGGAVGKFILAGSTSGSTIVNAAAVAGATTVTLQGVTGTVALLGDKLDAFAATTSAELATVISDETGSGLLVFGTSPTILTPTIASFANATHDHSNAAGGGQLLSTSALSDTANIAYVNTANTFGDFAQVFKDNQFFIENPAGTFEYQFVAAAIAADRVLNLPLLTTADTLAVLGLAQTFSTLQSFSAGIDLVGSNIDNVQKIIYDLETITSSTTITINFNNDDLAKLALAHNTTFSSSNLAIGKLKEIHITSTSAQTMAFPAGWTFYGVKPTTTTAGKDSVLYLTSVGSTDADVKAVFVEEA